VESEGAVEARIEARAVDRLGAFSDGVLAIAITLLALELPVPEGNTTGAFWASVRSNGGQYIAFLVSFAVIAIAWNNHHDIYRYVERVDARLRTLTMAWLCTIVLNPFATKMLTWNGPDSVAANALRFGFYSLLQLMAGLFLVAMLRHMVTHELAPEARERSARMARGTYGVILGFGLSIPVFFLTPRAWILWIVCPMLVGRRWLFPRQVRQP
jgi:uncharacterized membrane protein